MEHDAIRILAKFAAPTIMFTVAVFAAPIIIVTAAIVIGSIIRKIFNIPIKKK